jgi:hypothetical protein
VFADKGPAGFCEGDDSTDLLTTIAIFNSRVFGYLIQAQLARVSLAQSYEVGMVQNTPFPVISSDERSLLAHLARRAWSLKRLRDTAVAVSHAYLVPGVLAVPADTLAERAAAWATRVRTNEETVAVIQTEIDDLAFRLYGLDSVDRAALTSTLAPEATADAETGTDEEEESVTADAPALTADLLAYALGCAFGRWDIRYATGERPARARSLCPAPRLPAGHAPERCRPARGTR